jgi:YesN/AraC family two-component response regulator
MDGLELIRKAKQVEEDLKTILVTGYGTERLERQAEGLGVSAYLEKPFTPGCLARTIQGVLEGLGMNSEEPRTQWS